MTMLTNQVVSQETTQQKHDPMMSQHQAGKDNKQGQMMGQHQAGGEAKKNGGQGGHHGSVAKGVDKFPTIAYQGSPEVRPVQTVKVPNMQGDPAKGKKIAYDRSMGRCLNCHILGEDSNQPGNIGPNLSTFGNLGRSDEYIFQQIWDARAHNPNTMMPPFGSNELLSKHQVLHITAYLKTLKTPVVKPVQASKNELKLLVAGRDFTLADEYIEAGEKLFRRAGKNGKACSSCHQDNQHSLVGVAVNFPKANSDDKIINLEQQINQCRQTRMNSDAYKLGSPHSNHLTSYVKYLSRDVPLKVASKPLEQAALKRGKSSFYRKAGQLNFSCADCHANSDDKWLSGQYLSSIKPQGSYSSTAATWPRHFIAGHDLGLISLQQRIRHCQVVSRTLPLKLGSSEYVDMEIYLTSLANNAAMLAPTKSDIGIE